MTGPFMEDANDPTGVEFSVRDQFAATDPATPLTAPAAAPGQMGSQPPQPTEQPTPLCRRVTPETMIQFIDWAQLAQGLRQRAWIVLLLTATGLGLGLHGRSRIGAPRYEARASILYRTDRHKQATSAPGTTTAIRGLARATAVSLLRRAGNLEKVIESLSLAMTPEELGWRVQTQSDRNSEIILLRVEFMPSAELAIEAANLIVRIGIEDNQTFYRSQALQQADQFKLQAESAAAEADAARETLLAYQTRHQLLEVGADTKAFLDSMGAVNERLHSARIARDSQAVRIANYRRLVAEMPDEVMRESFEDNPLKRRIANAEVALMEARTRYGPENPRILQMEDSIREMRRTISEQTFDETRERVYVRNPAKQQFEMEVLRLEAEQEVLDQAVTHIEQQAAELKTRFAHLPAQQIELADFHQRHASAVDLLQRLERSIANSRMTAEMDLGDFEPLELARHATSSRGKLAALLPPVAVLGSLFASLALCVILTLTDPRLKSERQVARLYTLPCLGSAPVTEQTAVPVAFLRICRDLYRHVTRHQGAAREVVLAVLSACPGDGKSTLAYHAARYWAALGIKTAYLDFDDGPNPWLHLSEPAAGVEDYLAGRAAWNDAAFAQDGVTCFKRMRNTGDLPEQMHGASMLRLMDTLRAQCACIIIETPAWLADETSAGLLAGMADQTVWIAASPVTTRAVMSLAFDGLDRTGIRPVGMILNQVAGARRLRGQGTSGT